MYDTTIHAKTIARRLTKADFAADKNLFDPVYLAQTVKDAVAVGQAGFAGTPVKQSDLRGKKVYQLTRLKDLLVVRHVTANIRRITAVKQDNRKFIVECIKTLMSDGGGFRVYKYDIKNFYESVSIADITDKLKSDVAFSGQSSRVVISLFEEFKSQGISGLPRGLAISATLSEYILRSFDRKISQHKDVWYYSRFVDDIIVIAKFAPSPDAINEFSREALPPGLEFNRKSKSLAFEPWVKSNTNIKEADFDFLGYNFCVGKSYRTKENKIARSVSVDIAPSKIRRMKTRIAKSLLQFKSDGIFVDLHDRMRLLTSNFTFIDKASGRRRIAGIYYNYPLVDAATSTALSELDHFVRAAMLSPHKNNALKIALTNQQRLLLLRMTFHSGFTKKRFFNFPSKRISALKDCWKYA
jgi:hypothetical protein